jgi:hypothetical protein
MSPGFPYEEMDDLERDLLELGEVEREKHAS